MTSGVYKRTPEHNAANSKAQMGHKTSDKTRKKISEALSGVQLPPRTPEHCAAISAAKKDVPHSPEHIAALQGVSRPPRTPEHCTALSESMKNSEDIKANTDRMRGGQDMIWHHYIYDHANPKKYTMEVTRSKHGKIHVWMKRAGIVVPHINITEVNKNIFGGAHNEQ